MGSFSTELLVMETVFGALNKKMQLLEPILELLEEGIMVCDEKGFIHYVNQNFTKISGFPVSERLNKNIFEVNPNSVLAEILRTKKPKLNILTYKSGKEGKGIRNGYPIYIDGEFVGAVLILKDISKEVDLSIEENSHQSYLVDINRHFASYTISDIVAEEESMKELISQILKISNTSTPIALQGEPSVGKGTLAEAIHLHSLSNNKPFIRLDCTTLSHRDFRYKLFGLEKNAITETTLNSVGYLELAQGGTLYLDHLERLSKPIQAELIIALKTGKAFRVGEDSPYPVNLKVIASFNNSLKECFENGFLQEELFHYFNHTCFEIPPLRERKKDIPNLVFAFLKRYSLKFGKSIKKIEKEALTLLINYPWSGNVKELKNVIRQSVLHAQGEVITKKMVMGQLPTEYSESTEIGITSLEEVERNMIMKALNHFGYSLKGKKQAAEVLKVSLGTLYNKMRYYDLQE